MRQMTLPPHQATWVLSLCITGVSDDSARQHYLANRDHIESAIATYDTASLASSWYTLPRVPHGNAQDIVVGSITKKQLTDLYSEHLVKGPILPRKAYDEMLVRAGGKCPYCGALGIVSSLDHYVPKARFPIYAVLPNNLVPSCGDCNKGKGTKFAVSPDKQTLHPYYDNGRFFSERWIVARLARSEPPTVTFHCSPPTGWSSQDKRRAERHFKECRLAYRYGVVAGGELTKIIDARKNSLKGLSSEAFREHLLDGANTAGYDLNSWTRSLHAGLAETEWFLTADFDKPETYLQDPAA